MLFRSELVHPDDQYNPSQGYGHKHPHVRIRHTSGSYSTVRFKTVNQRTKSLASATLKGIVADEPLPSLRVYTEASKRIERGGWMAVCMTPINAPVEWFRGVIDEGVAAGELRPLTDPQRLVGLMGATTVYYFAAMPWLTPSEPWSPAELEKLKRDILLVARHMLGIKPSTPGPR